MRDLAGLRCAAFRTADFFATGATDFLPVVLLRAATCALDFFAALFLAAGLALLVRVAADLCVEVADFGFATAARLVTAFFAAGFFFSVALLDADGRDAGLRAVVFFLVVAAVLLLAAFFAVFFFATFAAAGLPLTFEPDVAFFRAGVFFVALRMAIQVSFSCNLVEPSTPLRSTSGRRVAEKRVRQ